MKPWRLLWLLLGLCALFSAPTAGAYTLSELRVRTEMALGQDTAATNKYWSNVELRYAVNSAINYICGLTHCYVRETVIVLNASQSEYRMSADYIQLKGAVVSGKGSTPDADVPPRGLIVVLAHQLGKDASDRNQAPTQIADVGDPNRTIRIASTPTVTRDTMRVSFAAYAPALDTDSSTCLLPVSFQELIPSLAASRAWAKMRRPDPYWGQFKEAVTVLAPMSQPQINEEPRTAKPNPE